jgi:hypothetical protein
MRKKKIELRIRERHLPTLSEGIPGLPTSQGARCWRVRVNLMQFFEKLISTRFQSIKRLSTNAQIRDQRKILLAQQPEIRRRLPVPLGNHAKVVTFGVGIQSKEQKRQDNPGNPSRGAPGKGDANAASGGHRRKDDLQEPDIFQAIHQNLCTPVMGDIGTDHTAIAFTDLSIKQGQ